MIQISIFNESIIDAYDKLSNADEVPLNFLLQGSASLGKEIEQAKNYDYVVVNNDFLTSVNTIYDLIKSKKEKREL